MFDDLLPVNITTDFSDQYGAIHDLLSLRFYWFKHLAYYLPEFAILDTLIAPYASYYPQDYETFTVDDLLSTCGNESFRRYHNKDFVDFNHFAEELCRDVHTDLRFRTAYEYIAYCIKFGHTSSLNYPFFLFCNVGSDYNIPKCITPVKHKLSKRDIPTGCEVPLDNSTFYQSVVDHYCPLVPYNKEYSGLCDFGRLNLACLTGTNIRAKRWDASSVCGWPLVSSGAKLVGGECSISPQLEQLKGVLSMSHDIVLNNVDLIDKLGKKLTLSDSRAQNNYRMLLELVNVTQHHSNSFDMFFSLIVKKL